MGVTGRVDSYQQRHRWAGLPLAVVYKFVDDQGSYLTALITYYGFVSLFPLLLLLVTVMGFGLQGSPRLQHRVLDSALTQFPVIGDQIATNIHSFHGSVAGLIVGVAGCSTVAWASSRPSRTPEQGLGRAAERPPEPDHRPASEPGAGGDRWGGGHPHHGAVGGDRGIGGYGGSVRAVATVVAIILNIALFTFAFRVLTAPPLSIAQVRA